jgi:hypothetical protein
MLSSYCRNCGAAHTTTAEMSANHCNGCETARTEAMAGAKEKDPKISPDDLLYKGREALIQRAHHPRVTFISPREFDGRDRSARS